MSTLNQTFVYHYSKEAFQDLRTREGRLKMTTADRNEVSWEKALSESYGTKWTRLSFMFDPVDREKIGKYFENRHPFWKPGDTIYEYKVALSDISLELGWFEVRNTPEELRLADKWLHKGRDYYRQRKAILEHHNYLSRYSLSLLDNVLKFQARQRDFFDILSMDRLKEEDLQCVSPHIPYLVVFPEFVTIKVKSRSSFVIPST